MPRSQTVTLYSKDSFAQFTIEEMPTSQFTLVNVVAPFPTGPLTIGVYPTAVAAAEEVLKHTQLPGPFVDFAVHGDVLVPLMTLLGLFSRWGRFDNKSSLVDGVRQELNFILTAEEVRHVLQNQGVLPATIADQIRRARIAEAKSKDTKSPEKNALSAAKKNDINKK